MNKLTKGESARDIADALREVPVWMVRHMRAGWQKHGAICYEAANLLDACNLYLKDGETPAERIKREREDVTAALDLLANEKRLHVSTIAKLRIVIEAADRMADAFVDPYATEHDKCDALTAYRNLTQETPHAG